MYDISPNLSSCKFIYVMRKKNNTLTVQHCIFLFGIVWLFKINSLLRLWHLSVYQLNNDVWALIAWENCWISSFFLIFQPSLPQLFIIWKWYAKIVFSVRSILLSLICLWSTTSNFFFERFRETLKCTSAI